MRDSAFLDQYGPWGIVAGASAGIGAAYAEQLARRGLDLVLIARRENALGALCSSLTEKYGLQARALILDLASPGVTEYVVQATGGLQVGLLVYNAAFSAIGAFLDRPLQDDLRELDTNIRTPLELVYSLGSQMLQRRRGGVILMSSLSSFQGSAYISAYSATKAFTTVLAEGLWEEWRRQGVDALVCISGAARTPGYISSSPRKTGGFSDSALEPRTIAMEALKALGRQLYVIPGRGNRFASFLMRHIMPRRMAIRLMGRVLRDMYIH